jgi:hypothetical protein
MNLDCGIVGALPLGSGERFAQFSPHWPDVGRSISSQLLKEYCNKLIKKRFVKQLATTIILKTQAGIDQPVSFTGSGFPDAYE